MNNLYKTNKKGFTIVETLVAIAILMIAIAGPLTVAQKALTASIYARDQVIASFLAQDAMEYIKNVRDNNVKDLANYNNNWLFSLDSCTSGGSQCSVDTMNGVVNGDRRISTCTDCSLWLNTTGGFTPPGTGTNKSQFNRSFYIEPINDNSDDVRVVVTVSWQNGTISNAVTLENELFNINR